MEESTGIIILAAGQSSRLGQPKQLLQFRGKSLLQRTIEHAILDANHVVVLVTGANGTAVEAEINNLDIICCYNKEWEEGMGSSIKAGLKHLLVEYPSVVQCIICVCDQPFADDAILQSLKHEQLRSGKGIVACSYAGTLGVPVLFTQNYFDTLLNLQCGEGAKKLIFKYSTDVSAVPFELGAIDIDTIDDYNQLNELNDFSTGS